VREWQVLKDTQIANPARNLRLKKVLKTMARKLGRGRRHSPVMMEVSVRSELSTVSKCWLSDVG
jgi:hypothetical protein